MSQFPWFPFPRNIYRQGRWIGFLLIAALGIGYSGAHAEDDPPGRIGRIANLQGQAWLFDVERWEWLPTGLNRPLTTGDRLAVAEGGRAVVRIGSTAVRVDGGGELEMKRLDDERISLFLHNGSVALRVTSPEVTAEIELATREGRLFPRRPGHYRFDRRDGATQATAWSGELYVLAQAPGMSILAGQRIELRQEASPSLVRAAVHDAFSDWVARDVQDERMDGSANYVSPEMTGWEDLDRHGRWESHSEYGALWLPSAVAVDWAPYRFGRWLWVRPWGWTWVDDAPWGFAPFHYGRWVMVGGRWAWAPGQRVHRPVYAPALVAWTSGSSVSVSVGIGLAPSAGWVPLAPHDHYRPHYRSSAAHERNLNLPHRHGPVRPGADSGRPGDAHSDRSGPGGFTAVPPGVFSARQPVAPVVKGHPPSPPPAQERQDDRDEGANRHRRPHPVPAPIPGTAPAGNALGGAASPPARSMEPPGGATPQRRKPPAQTQDDREERPAVREGRRHSPQLER